jgi:enediyne biosynthesis protein E4
MKEPAAPQDDQIIGRALLWSLTFVCFAVVTGWFIRQQWFVTPPLQQRLSASPIPTYPALPSPVPASPSRAPDLPFADVTALSGIEFVHHNGATPDRRLPEAMGGGVTCFDYDLDGDDDVLFVQTAASSEDRSSLLLYSNQGQGTFRDVTIAAGLHCQLMGMAASAADFDNDGWPDLFVTGVHRQLLWHNRDGCFVDVTDAAHVAAPAEAWGLPSCWLDYDRDGDLDLFVGRYLQWSAELDDRLQCRWNGVDASYCDPDVFAGQQPLLYQNQGDGTFAEVAEAAGLFVRNPDTGQPVPKIVSAASSDLNHDGWPDLVASCDGVAQLLYLNRQNGQFQEVASSQGIAFDRQGQAVRSLGLDVGWNRQAGVPLVAMGRIGNVMNALFRQDSSRRVWLDQALLSGFGTPSRLDCTFGVHFADLDLDGRLDLVTSNGQMQDNLGVLQASQTRSQPPRLYWQSSESPLRFEPLNAALAPLPGRGVTSADLDRDGDLDLLFGANGDRPRLLRNDQVLSRHWLQLDLRGRHAPRDPWGCRLELRLPRTVLIDVVQPSTGYLSQRPRVITWGLGDESTIEQLTIIWPDGHRQIVRDLAVDQRHTIVQSAVHHEAEVAEPLASRSAVMGSDSHRRQAVATAETTETPETAETAGRRIAVSGVSTQSASPGVRGGP